MNISNNLAACLVAIPALAFSIGRASAESLVPSPLPPPCYPVPAGELISWLPSAPENWKLLASTGRSVFEVSCKPVTIIARHYQYVPPMDASGTPHPKLTDILLVLTDTAFLPDMLGLFAGSGGHDQIKRISGVPALSSQRSSGETIVVFLLGGRMTLTVSGNSDEKDVLEWSEKLPLAELQRKSFGASRTPFKGTSYLEKFVNQLNPKENREGLTGFTLENTPSPEQPKSAPVIIQQP